MGLLTLNELSGLGDAWVVLPNGSRLKLPERRRSVRGIWSRRGIREAARAAEGQALRDEAYFVQEFKRAFAKGEDSPEFHRFMWEWDPKRRRRAGYTDPISWGRRVARAISDPVADPGSAVEYAAWRPTQEQIDRMLRLHRAARQKRIDAQLRKSRAAAAAERARVMRLHAARVQADRGRDAGYVGISPEAAKRQRERSIAWNALIRERNRVAREREEAAHWAERRRVGALEDAARRAALARDAARRAALTPVGPPAPIPIYGPPAPIPIYGPPAPVTTPATSGTLVSRLPSAPPPPTYSGGTR